LNDNDVILFQGDSITDWGRDRNKTAPNDTKRVRQWLCPAPPLANYLAKYPQKNLQIYNKGSKRQQGLPTGRKMGYDCIALKPTVVSIHIGVNDFWHTLGGGYTGTIETYITDYKKLIDRTQSGIARRKTGNRRTICHERQRPLMINGTQRLMPTARQPAILLPNTMHHSSLTKPYLIKRLNKPPATYWTIRWRTPQHCRRKTDGRRLDGNSERIGFEVSLPDGAEGLKNFKRAKARAIYVVIRWLSQRN
jgi:lysophospholipase L1-like esterase